MFPGKRSSCSAAFEDLFNRKITGSDFMISEEFNRKKRNIVKSPYFRTVLAKTI